MWKIDKRRLFLLFSCPTACEGKVVPQAPKGERFQKVQRGKVLKIDRPDGPEGS